MLVLQARNVNDAWEQAKHYLNSEHVIRPSRVGEVWEYPTPVMTEYQNPTERVLFSPTRNANPYFHLFESLWMLAGREDVEWIARFLPRMREFSDDGVTLTGAYGKRWRDYFNVYSGANDPDQLNNIVEMLQRSPDERRAVLTMFDPNVDLNTPSKDCPCNTQAYFKVRDGKLDMTVTCRSNDIAWGAYGANAVHFSVLLEYMAARIGIPVGTYYHLSDSWHAYTERWESLGGTVDESQVRDLYTSAMVKPTLLVDDARVFDDELQDWVSRVADDGTPGTGYVNTFLDWVATPMLKSWKAWKSKDWDLAFDELNEMPENSDWGHAADQFLIRRAKAKGAE